MNPLDGGWGQIDWAGGGGWDGTGADGWGGGWGGKRDGGRVLGYWAAKGDEASGMDKSKGKGKAKSKGKGRASEYGAWDPAGPCTAPIPLDALPGPVEDDLLPTASDPAQPPTKLLEAIQLVSHRALTSRAEGGAHLDGAQTAHLLGLLSSTLQDVQRVPEEVWEVYAPRSSSPTEPVRVWSGPAEASREEKWDFDFDWRDDDPPRPEEQSPTGPCYISKLPAELLTAVFELARDASAEPRTRLAAGDVEETDLLGRPLGGSKTAAMHFAFGLARVCKKWTEPARTVAYRKLTIHHGLGLVKLNAVLSDSTSIGSSLTTLIHSLDIVIPASYPDDPLEGLLSRGSPSQPARSPLRRGQAAASSEDKKERDASTQFAQLVARCRSLDSLTLRIVTNTRDVELAPSYSDYLEPTVFHCLNSIPTLRHLHLSHVTDFEELEQIILASPLLESLKLDWLDNISSANGGQVSSPIPHRASRIRTVYLSNSNFLNRSTLSPAQLVWLLQPAVDSRSLREMQLYLVGSGSGGPSITTAYATTGGVYGGGFAPPFASAEFAELLARCGESLETLALQDGSYSGMINQSLLQDPHNGSLDHALSSLSSLRILALFWSATGSSLLSSLSPLPHIKHLNLSGTPEHTSASAFAEAMELGFPALRRVVFGGAGAVGGERGMGRGGGGAGGNAWTGVGMRKVREVGEKRGIKVRFERSPY